jgi:hypothetical protein
MQTATSIDDWRPGFAKRADNFHEVCDRAQAWRWEPGVSVPRILYAVIVGTPELTIPQRMTLLVYAQHLNQDRLEQNLACVWPSSKLVARYLGCGVQTARAHRRALESKGYMVRDYTRANRPAGEEAYDLAPLVARLEEMEDADGAIRAVHAAERAAQYEAVVGLHNISAREAKIRHLEQSQKNVSSSVQEMTDAPSARIQSLERRAAPSANGKTYGPSTNRQRIGQDSAICSPEGAGGLGGGQSAPSVRAEMARQELQAAFQVSPRLAALVGPAVVADPLSASPADIARVAFAIPELLPEPERNNGQTFEWALKRHGLRAIAMLAIAIEDTEVRSPCKYFGKMASYEPLGAPDLRLNLARILRAKGDIPPPPAAPTPETLMEAPGADDPCWRSIDEQLRQIVKTGVYGSWFGRIGFHGLRYGILHLSTPTGIAADRIKRDFMQAILQAAEAAGHEVERVSIIVRKLT